MPRLLFSTMLAVLVALVAVVAADDFLDQEMSGFVTTYKIPAGGVWQSFTPSYTANLTSVGLMIGATFKSVPCVPFSGTIKVYQGVGKKGVSGPFFVAQQPLTQQVIASNDCRCNNDDCVSWQKFELSVPVTIVGGEVYSFHIIPATTATSFRVGLMVVDTYSRGENNFAAPGYDYPFKTYMHAQQSETLTLTGNKGTNDQATTTSASKSSSSTTVVVVIAVVTALAVLVAVIVVVIRRRRRDGEWLSAEDAINVWKNRFAGKDVEPPVKKHDRSRVYVIKEEAAKPEDKPEGAIHDNWVKEQWQRYTVRAEAGDSLRWREKAAIALPDSLQFESTVDMPEYDPEADNLDNIELPEQYDDHGHETVMLY